MKKDYVLSSVVLTPIGLIAILTKNDKLIRVQFDARPFPHAVILTPLNERLMKDMETYFVEPNHQFEVEMDLQGTPFQKRVWEAISKIPPGTTLTYGQLAAQCGSSPRAVGNACRANPVPVIVPCHRVIAKDHIGGYVGHMNGEALDIKKWLLEHESIKVPG
jgi:methylated-DNA-[protein]-cysteine S-methyltransferase